MILWGGTLAPATVEEKIQHASAAGFTGLSIAPMEVGPPGSTVQHGRRLRAFADDHGIALACLDPVTSWLPLDSGSTSPSAQLSMSEVFQTYSLRECLDLAHTVGAGTISAVDTSGLPRDHGLLVDSLAAIYETAHSESLVVQLEPMPFSAVRDISCARSVIVDSNCSHVGIAFDCWHFGRSTDSREPLTALQKGAITSVQLNDGPRTPAADPWDEATNHRLFPGDGEMDVMGMFAAVVPYLREGALIGPEVISADARGAPAAHVAANAKKTSDRMID
ncbi:sugar phosphate isomerase/epimerase family protein [Gordonia rubripertincta]|uniref:TIM barrel protein n=1 Tax=Gordonia rubripertincta TaxID=36822 RepID=A0ABT4MNK6_GORRU|nr:TIM barrel protein [Gordonia rubripertincta]MCZ4548586.1 TIM barrel protein [Gordonia rubripertincta]